MAQFRKKIGTVAMRYLFELTIIKLELELPYSIGVNLIFKKGKSLRPILSRLNES